MRQQVKRDVERQVSRDEERAYEELYGRLDTKEGEKDLYRLARQRDRAGKDVLQVRAVKDGEGNVLTSEESVLRRWREYFEQLMNEENQRERRLDDVELVKQEVDRISKEEVRAAIKRMKSGKSVGPDDILVEAWRCLGEMAVNFLTRLFNRILEGPLRPHEGGDPAPSHMVHMSADLSWAINTSSLVKKAHQRLFFLRTLRKNQLSSDILVNFYRFTIESILTSCVTVWYGSCSVAERRARTTGTLLPAMEDIQKKRCLC
ncbi:gastrula zinc finger protein XlCGF28.1-like [Silurus asotus]|uniref:Gastrula zinc finger protein XlCGF28.1-like n=1 Tax=Silurus asotus TaxID=30991 RepID=A0AAD5AWN9_SILAS|nr:gastrula zinc finger protein XlCGF28.1-like [Silurus asotus]